MVKTPITQAIAQIKIWKDINRLTDDDFERFKDLHKKRGEQNKIQVQQF